MLRLSASAEDCQCASVLMCLFAPPRRSERIIGLVTID